jgi:hypothetical protein
VNGVNNDDLTSTRRIKLNRNFENKIKIGKRDSPAFHDEISYDVRQLKKRKLCDLSCSDIINIAHKVKIEHLSYKDSACLLHVKPTLVASIISKCEKDPQFLVNCKEKELETAKEKDVIVKVATSMY